MAGDRDARVRRPTREADAAWEVAQVRGAPPRLAARRSPRSTCGTASRCSRRASWRRPRRRCARRRRSSTPGGSAPSRAIYTGAFHARALIERGRRRRGRAMLETARPRWSTRLRGRRATGGGTRLALLVAEGRDAEAVVAATEEYARPARARRASRRRRTGARRRRARWTGWGGTTRRSRWPRPSSPTRDTWGAPGTVGPVAARARRASRATSTCSRRRSRCSSGSHARLEHAKALADLGAALRRERRPTDAREPLRRALELADACSRRRARRARARGALRDRRAPAHDGARRRRRADGQRAAGGGLRRRRAEQPRHRAGAVRHAQDRRGPPLATPTASSGSARGASWRGAELAARLEERLGAVIRGSPRWLGAAGASMLSPMTSRAVTITLELRQAGDELDGRASDGIGPTGRSPGGSAMLVASTRCSAARRRRPKRSLGVLGTAARPVAPDVPVSRRL